MAYSVHLAQFEGPLDLLLHLIEEAELDIKDIFISEITAQYLAYMGQVDELDMDTASEFLTMAATLLYIKSRQLLPRPPKEDTEEEDPETVLLRQLREYKAFKEASGDLQALFEDARAGITRLPEDVPLPPKEVSLENTTMDGLYDAFLALLNRVETKEERTPSQHRVLADTYTIRMQMGRIRSRLQKADTVQFEELFDGDATKMEMIVTFMALLEMIAHGEITLRQKVPFAPITIEAARLREDGEDEMTQYMDETDE